MIEVEPGVKSTYRRDVQGLRAVAVLAVIAYHADDLLPGGFVGVDVFFVISGFVIMRSLQAENDRSGRIDLASFYRRRIRRLTPVLTLAILTVVPLSVLFGPIGSIETGARTGRSATLFAANIFIGRNTGYFDSTAELNPLNHTWSLSLEEQFYFVFPVFLLLLFSLARSRGMPRAVVHGLILFSILSLVFGLLMSYLPADGLLGISQSRSWAFFLMPTRAWQFGVGAILAVLAHHNESRFAVRGLAGVGGLLMLLSFIVFNDGLNYPGVFAVLPTIAATVVIANPDASVLRPLSHPAMVRMGDVSYSWYLWHWPAMVFAGAAGVDSRPLLLLAGLATLPLAMITYDHVEMRFRLPGRESGRGKWVGITAASLVVGVSVVGLAAISLNAAPTDVASALSATERGLAGTCPRVAIAPGLNGCQFGGGNERVVLVGDSNADQFSESVVGAAQRLGWQSTIISQAGCPVIDVVVRNDGFQNTACERFSSGARAWIIATSPEVVVISVATDIHLGLEGRSIARGDALGADAYAEALQEFVRDLAAVGSRAIVVDPIPKFSLEPGLESGSRSCSSTRILLRSSSCGLSMTRDEAQERRAEAMDVVDRALAGTAGARYDPFDFVCPGTRCLEIRDGIWQYRDVRHTSTSVAKGLIPQFTSLLSGD